MPTVSVVTSTIGRDTLHKTIESVQKQTIDCRHYVFVHGKEFHEKAEKILSCYPDVEALYLPNNNGLPNYGMAPVFALAPYVVSEDYLFYLDDDNFFDDNHVETLVNHIEINNLDWSFSLRKIVDQDGNYLCHDDCDSLGYFQNADGSMLVDNSCFALKTPVAREHAHAWYYPVTSDRNFMMSLFDGKKTAGCTGLHTCNYRLSKDGYNAMSIDMFHNNNEFMKHRHNNNFMWRFPSVNTYKGMVVSFTGSRAITPDDELFQHDPSSPSQTS